MHLCVDEIRMILGPFSLLVGWFVTLIRKAFRR
jgi:hypothetical protein